jgi:hypothetical protein
MKKVTFNITWNNPMFREHLKQVHYWYDRFEWSRDIDHLDNAERHADAVQEFLPQ